MMISLNPWGRVATVKRTGERFIVQHIDVDAGKVYCVGNVIAYSTKHPVVRARFQDTKTYQRDSVSVIDMIIDRNLLGELFKQTRESPAFRPDIMSGNIEVLKEDGVWRIRNAPKAHARIETLKCPVHGEHMRVRRAPKGGFFGGCPTRSETDCNVTVSMDGKETWSGL